MIGWTEIFIASGEYIWVGSIYGTETQGLRGAERRKLDVFEMVCQISMYELTFWNSKK